MYNETDDLTWLWETYENFFKKFGMDRDNIISVYHDWKENEDDTVKKYLWTIFEKLLLEAYEHTSTLQSTYSVLALIYSEMRDYKNKYEGEEANDIHKKYLYCQLKLIELQNPNSTVKTIAGHCCPYCLAMNGWHISVDEALHEQYLPAKRCSNGIGCNCSYRRV